MEVYMIENSVNLTSAEFLSLYTGVLLAESFEIVPETCKKVFGFDPYTHIIIECTKQFRQNINKERPDLAEAVKKLGKFKAEESEDVSKQMEDYCKKFEETIGSDSVEVQKMKFKEIDFSM